MRQHQFCPRTVRQRHRGQGQAFKGCAVECKQQVVRQVGQRMRERFARMTIGREVVLRHQRAEAVAQDRNGFGRCRQRVTGPQAGLDRHAIGSGRNDEVEGRMAMHGRNRIGFGQHRCLVCRQPVARLVPLFGRQNGIADRTGDTERGLDPALGRIMRRAQQREIALKEPVQQCGALAIAEAHGFIRHHRLHLAPVGDRRAYMAKRRRDCRFQVLANQRVTALGLHIDQRRADALGIELFETFVCTARNADDGVQDTVDRQAACGDRVRDRVDKERHVVVDDRHPHQPPSVRTGTALDPNRRIPSATGGKRFEHEFGRRLPVVGVEIGDLTGQGPGDECLGQSLELGGIGSICGRNRAVGSHVSGIRIVVVALAQLCARLTMTSRR